MAQLVSGLERACAVEQSGSIPHSWVTRPSSFWPRSALRACIVHACLEKYSALETAHPSQAGKLMRREHIASPVRFCDWIVRCGHRRAVHCRLWPSKDCTERYLRNKRATNVTCYNCKLPLLILCRQIDLSDWSSIDARKSGDFIKTIDLRLG